MCEHIELDALEDDFDDDSMIECVNGSDEFYENYMAVVVPGEFKTPRRRGKRIPEYGRCNVCNHVKLNRIEYCPYCGARTGGGVDG